MEENVLYADLNLPEPTRPRLQEVPDVQGCTYAEVKVNSQDTNAAANCRSSGKCRCSRTGVTALVAVLVVLILVVVTALYLTLRGGPTAGSQQDSTTTIPEEALGCPPTWEKHGRKCYFFYPKKKEDWKVSREECIANSSDLVIIDSREELKYLLSRSKYKYFLLGLTHSHEEQKWKWINNVEHDPAMFNIEGDRFDYLCTVIGFGEVHTAPCGGSETTQNMCEKAATISKRQKES